MSLQKCTHEQTCSGSGFHGGLSGVDRLLNLCSELKRAPVKSGVRGRDRSPPILTVATLPPGVEYDRLMPDSLVAATEVGLGINVNLK